MSLPSSPRSGPHRRLLRKLLEAGPIDAAALSALLDAAVEAVCLYPGKTVELEPVNGKLIPEEKVAACMGCNGDIVLRISSERLGIALEQQKKGGVVARKNILPEALAACILGSRYDEKAQAAGLLPEGCIAAILEDTNTAYFIRYPELYADISCYPSALTGHP